MGQESTRCFRMRTVMDDYTQMAIFSEVVEQGSFTAAAERLGVSKSFVSKQVSLLESRLGGVKLLRRTTRRLKLTEEGAKFFDYCRRMVETAQEGVQLLQSRSHEVSGPLRVSAPITYGQTFLTEVVESFCDLYREVRVDLLLDNRRVDLLAENIDVAIRITESPPQTLFLTPLGVMEDVICCAPSYLSGREVPTKPSDLEDHECLLYLNPERLVRWALRKERRVHTVQVRGRTAYNYHSALLKPLLAGQGVAKLPQYFVAAYLRTGRLVRLLATYEADQIPIYLVHHDPAGQPPRVREFIDFCRRQLTRVASGS